MESNICSINHRKNNEWTNESHSNYLSLMEESFVKTMFERNYFNSKFDNSNTNTNTNTFITTTTNNNNSRLDRFVPDMAESTLDSQPRKPVTTQGAIRKLDAIKTRRSIPRQRLRFHPYKIMLDQVVPQVEDKASDTRKAQE